MGISLETLFKAMTIENARILGIHNDIGSVEKGKVANLLLLSKNPLKDITAYDSISWVILKGVPIQRDTLSALSQ
jgi:imidazolonepropionase-like amidohydrolase